MNSFEINDFNSLVFNTKEWFMEQYLRLKCITDQIQEEMRMYSQHNPLGRFTQIRPTWTIDEQGFFYTKFIHDIIPTIDDNKRNPQHHQQQQQRRHALFYHRLNESYQQDCLVVDFPDKPKYLITSAVVTKCGKYLIIIIKTPEYVGHNLYFVRLYKENDGITKRFKLIQVVYKWGAEYQYITNIKSKMIFLTDKGAPNRRLIIVDFNNPRPKCHCKWRILIPEHTSYFLNYAEPVNQNRILLNYINGEKCKFKVLCLQTCRFIDVEQSSSSSSSFNSNLKQIIRDNSCCSCHPKDNSSGIHRSGSLHSSHHRTSTSITTTTTKSSLYRIPFDGD